MGLGHPVDLVDAVTPLQARVAFDQLDGTMTERIGAVDPAGKGVLGGCFARLPEDVWDAVYRLAEVQGCYVRLD